ncbi:MAG: hypothetical protein EOO93_26540, partial [Pedobacter sp.]
MRFVIWLILCFCGGSVLAQEGYRLKVSLPDNLKSLSRYFSISKEIKDSLEVYKEADKLLSQLQFRGYLLAEITDLDFQGKEALVMIKPNQLYQWVQLSSGNLPSAVKQIVGFRERNYEGVNFNVEGLTQLFKTLLTHYENSGYPFASVSLQQIKIDTGAISASIEVKPNQKFMFDTLQVVGSAQIVQKYLQSYLNTKNGTLYSEKAISQIENSRTIPSLIVLIDIIKALDI